MLAGAVEDWRSAEIKATINIEKINVQLDTNFFSMWRDGSSKKITLRK